MPSVTRPPSQSRSEPDGHLVDTLQQLIVAFVLAMTFRGFVAEGFVIPTGSMAPTLMGQHIRTRSQFTGAEVAVGLDPDGRPPRDWQSRMVDPMLGPNYPGTGVPAASPAPRMGDRIFVVKSLYPFSQPHRFDVVVFKNPTDPTGPAENYIKRLIGLPNETVWLADGDVFTRSDGNRDFEVRRKPEHVQRAVWQPVFDSDFVPLHPMSLGRPYNGPPWIATPAEQWTIDDVRSFRCETADRAELSWRWSSREIDDWTPYNMLTAGAGGRQTIPVSDVRVAAAIVADAAGFSTTLRLHARRHVFEFSLRDNQAILRMIDEDEAAEVLAQTATPLAAPAPGRVANVEFWHVDQAMSIYIDGELVAQQTYDWTAEQRLRWAVGVEDESVDAQSLVAQRPRQPLISWSFEGAPFTLHRVRVDRDLHYRYDRLVPGPSQQKHAPYIHGHAFATSLIDNVAALGPDHFMMLGDNSSASLDSRLWGRPHPIVAAQIDDSPFIVNRKLLLGKAWVVYFPSPLSVSEGGRGFIPDFGRLRFIR